MRTSRLAGGLLRAGVLAFLLLLNAVLIGALVRPELVPWDVATGPRPAAPAEAPAPAADRGAWPASAGRTSDDDTEDPAGRS